MLLRSRLQLTDSEFTAITAFSDDPCKDSPCQNGGTCSKSNATKSGYKCACTEDFMGIHCEKSE